MLRVLAGCGAAAPGGMAAVDHTDVDGAGVRRFVVGRRTGAEHGVAGIRSRQPGGDAVGHGRTAAICSAIPAEERARRQSGGGVVVSAGSGGGVHRMAGPGTADGDKLRRNRSYGAGAGGDAGAGVDEAETGAADEQSGAGGGCDAICDVRLPGRRNVGRTGDLCRVADSMGRYGGGAGLGADIDCGGQARVARGGLRLRLNAIFRKGSGDSGL